MVGHLKSLQWGMFLRNQQGVSSSNKNMFEVKGGITKDHQPDRREQTKIPRSNSHPFFFEDVAQTFCELLSLGIRCSPRQRMSKGRTITETKRKVFRFHATILRR